MKSFRFAMWQHGNKIMLVDVIGRLSMTDSVSWRLMEFYGTGAAPDGMGMVDFENEVRQRPAGYLFTAEGLGKFASGLTDIYDLKLIGTDRGHTLVELEAVDSDYWEITIDEEFSSFDELKP
ncbi:MAG: hypothetical protein JNN30_00660 [Rhodanobacteraceae bacterium]|nr:hypothetical protein [Rhodanobacteraceae bacterium]